MLLELQSRSSHKCRNDEHESLSEGKWIERKTVKNIYCIRCNSFNNWVICFFAIFRIKVKPMDKRTPTFTLLQSWIIILSLLSEYDKQRTMSTQYGHCCQCRDMLLVPASMPFLFLMTLTQGYYLVLIRFAAGSFQMLNCSLIFKNMFCEAKCTSFGTLTNA